MRILVCAFLLSTCAWTQSLQGVIDFQAHSDTDSVPRSIDAIDLARLAKSRGMRGLVLKNHWESTAALAYVVRKMNGSSGPGTGLGLAITRAIARQHHGSVTCEDCDDGARFTLELPLASSAELM